MKHIVHNSQARVARPFPNCCECGRAPKDAKSGVTWFILDEFKQITTLFVNQKGEVFMGCRAIPEPKAKIRLHPTESVICEECLNEQGPGES